MMKDKVGGYVALVLGLVLIVIALVVKFVIVPSQAQWPPMWIQPVPMRVLCT